MYYLINAWVEKGGMLPKYAPWCSLSKVGGGSLWQIIFGENGEKIRKYLNGRSRPYIYL